MSQLPAARIEGRLPAFLRVMLVVGFFSGLALFLRQCGW